MTLFRALVLVAISLEIPALVAQQPPVAPRPITIGDLFQIREVDDPQITPDSQWVAYTVTTTNRSEDKTEDRIWMVPAAGGDPVPLTAEGVSSSQPHWSPDGKWLAFLSARNEGKTQVWLLNRSGGEAQKLTDTPQDVDDFAWSPDSRRLVLILRDPSPEELEAAKDKGKDASEKKPKTPKPWVIDRLQFKRDTVGYLDHRRKHLYVFDIAARKMTQLTTGDYDDSDPSWSPDGKLLAFVSKRAAPDPDRSYNTDIWIVSSDTTDKAAQPTQVTSNPGEDRSPAWSPDGKWITYSTQLDPKAFQYATHHIAVTPLPALGARPAEAKVLTQSFDRDSSQPQFAPDGKGVYFIADEDGTQNLCLVDIATQKISRPINGRLMLYSFTLSRTAQIAAHVVSLDRPDEVYTLVNGKLARVTHTNDELISKLKLTPGEYVEFKSKDGTLVHGYLYKPLDYVPGKKYPTILRPHGGPVWAYYAEFSHLAQLLAANGYVVLFPNPRGSTGYGEAYAKAIWADWGNKDFQDDMAMVDYAIGQGIADPEKLGVMGWSYGGISTDFIIAQSNRFKAAISGAGVSEFTSMYGHDQYQLDYFTELGYPWENKAAWDRLSFFYKIKDITTPTLFMGGNTDWNVPIVGGEQMYQALKALGRETQLVVYPDEYHEFKAPSHLEDRLMRYLAWMGHYVKGDAAPAALPQDTATSPKPAN